MEFWMNRKLFYWIWAATGPCGPSGSGGLDEPSGLSGFGGPTGSSVLGGPTGSSELADQQGLANWQTNRVWRRFWYSWFIGERMRLNHWIVCVGLVSDSAGISWASGGFSFQILSATGARRVQLCWTAAYESYAPHKGQKRELRVRWRLEKRIQTAPQFELTFTSRSNFELLLYSFQVAVEIVWIHFTHLEIWLTRDWLTWWLVPADMSCRFLETESESRG